METEQLNKEIMNSRNKGLFNKLVEQIRKYPFELIVRSNYINGLYVYTIVKDKGWREVYQIE